VNRHARNQYYVVGEGILTEDAQGNPVRLRASTLAELREFRFSRLGPVGERPDPEVTTGLANAMTEPAAQPDSADPGIPAGFTYLGQFVDHDLTMDRTAVALGQDVTVEELMQGRSPVLDLDSLYGRGPGNADDSRFYADDGVHLRVGTTSAVPIDAGTNVALTGFDLPRVGAGATKADQRAPLIPDARNDENLAVAQTHLAFIRFHNQVADTLADHRLPGPALFALARAEVTRHYQWMLRTDFLPRIVDPAVVDDVFTHGRRFLEVPQSGPYGEQDDADSVSLLDRPTMPIEFAVAAYRLGHSMVRGAYQWNRVFNSTARLGIATLFQLFTFTGTSGILTPTARLADLDDPNAGTFLTLPTNWIIDWRRLHDFSSFTDRPELLPPAATGGGNVTKRIDTLLVNPLADLPAGTFAGRGQGLPVDSVQRNLAFRNLTRAGMVSLASGRQMARFLGVPPLSDDQLLTGSGGADLSGLTDQQSAELLANPPLWFYVLREAEVADGRLAGVGARLVAEEFHRAIEAATFSILRNPLWRPSFGPDHSTFRMVDLLLFGAQDKVEILNPLGDTAP
jgi:hypothetical protein